MNFFSIYHNYREIKNDSIVKQHPKPNDEQKRKKQQYALSSTKKENPQWVQVI